ncbi:hypothetical protein IGS68_34740 (plasmid) [Skermanella sp. TT6]|uniref:Uncharacterized protein n=1 Tax=Skermanella cutis TaxID=2775420 RepID=A0ABX7BI17_9PROT|nr:hypothetical protein [Skermanella sp. TT6]QQP94004.1 hypothetical protein IGS68_34740 [Skermanella sp. TT6]
MIYDFYKEEFDEKAYALAVEAVLGRFLQRGGKIGKTRNEQMAFMEEVQSWLDTVHDRNSGRPRAVPSDDTAAKASKYARRIIEGPFSPEGPSAEEIERRQGA